MEPTQDKKHFLNDLIITEKELSHIGNVLYNVEMLVYGMKGIVDKMDIAKEEDIKELSESLNILMKALPCLVFDLKNNEHRVHTVKGDVEELIKGEIRGR